MTHSPSSPLWILTLGALMFGCGAATDAGELDSPALAQDEQPIVGGRRDRGDKAVVAIDIAGEALCTGTLIAPRVVLTARHCVSETSESVACPARSRQVKTDRDPSTLTVLVGDDVATATPVAAGEAIETPNSAVLCGHDIALLRLDRVVTGITPASVNLDAAVVVGEELRMVGFGKRGDDLGAGKKYRRLHVPVLSVTRPELVVGEVSCNGDSGGPAFDEVTGKVVGVVSRGGPGCEGPTARNIYTRTDAFAPLIRRALLDAR